MAPELFENKPQYTIKSDIYSYGMVLWELSARQVPFKEVANPGLVVAQVCMGKREAIPQDTPPKLAKLMSFVGRRIPKIDQLARKLLLNCRPRRSARILL